MALESCTELSMAPAHPQPCALHPAGTSDGTGAALAPSPAPTCSQYFSQVFMVSSNALPCGPFHLPPPHLPLLPPAPALPPHLPALPPQPVSPSRLPSCNQRSCDFLLLPSATETAGVKQRQSRRALVAPPCPSTAPSAWPGLTPQCRPLPSTPHPGPPNHPSQPPTALDPRSTSVFCRGHDHSLCYGVCADWAQGSPVWGITPQAAE